MTYLQIIDLGEYNQTIFHSKQLYLEGKCNYLQDWKKKH